METLLLTLLGLQTVMGMGHWCEHLVEERVERVLSPRLQLEVSCSEVYQYNTQDWRLDVDRMRVKHGGDDGIALYYKQQGPKASCFLYKPPEMENQMVNKTVRACCEGWGGPRCSEDAQSSPLVRSGLLGSTRVPQGSATCMSWGGAHYRTFDRKHFHFQGTCTYLLASSTDGTWAVYTSTVCDGRGDCSKALRMMLGLDLVSVRHRNLTLNNLPVANGEPLFQNGVSVHWLGDFVFVESGLGVRVKFDLANTVYLTVTAEHLAATRGLCGVYNNNADDDFTTMGGAVSQFAASFGNSWKVPDQQNEDCSDAAELGHSCDVSGDAALRKQAESVCHRLLENPFTHCHPRLDPAAYVDTCLYLYCSLPPKERDGAVCDTLASYARECAQQHVIIVWRTATLCGNDKIFVCRAGQWQCTGEKCAGQCSLMGALQVTTFDKKRYSLQGGDCHFTAVEDFVDRKLVVKVRCGECTAGGGGGGGGGGLGCLREMSVTALRTTVTITDTGTVMLNGQREALPVVTGDLVVRRASSSFLLVQTFGAQLLWYLDGPLALITLQPGFANKVRGLCGTLTWSQHDDFTTPEGDVENSVSSFAGKFTSERCTLPEGAPPDPCTTYTQRRSYAETVCSIIHSPVFQGCHDVVEREPYFRLCLSEVCGCTPQKACHCTVLTAYARQCAQEGVAVQWRNHTFCPVQCSGGQVYQECGRACGGSCSDLRQSWSCDDGGGIGLRMCVPGCQCPPGLVQDHQSQCVPVAMCPCVQEDKTYRPGTVIENNCNTCVCEQGKFNCTQEPCEEVNPCPGSLVYSPRSCLLTCSSLDPPGQQQGPRLVGQSGCKEPLSGCVCPQGTVLLGDRCVLPDECPCHHNGRLYYGNDTITKDCNTCVCKERRWNCSQLACAGVCVATGDPHYVTFDGRCYSFLGDCQYVLARETSGLFSVTAENVPCGSTGVTCTKSVTLSLGNTVIHLLRGKAVTVNGMPVSLPKSYSGSGLSLEQVGLFVSLSSRHGVTLLWDGGMRVYVRLAAHLRGRVGGLCGNFDGDTENDFTTRQGIVESTAELFGNSWKVSPSCPDVEDQDMRDPCALNAHRVTWARKRCAVLTQELFSQCHPEVPFQQYYDWCVFDACGCDSGGDCECLCTAIAAYAEECNRRGVYIRWRSQELCPLQCENGLVYNPCGPACSTSCPSVQQSPHSQCDALSCVEGCFCPAGTVRHGDSCVVPTVCPCEWDGSMFPPGSTITQNCQNCSCEDGAWQCGGVACPPPSPPCLESEFTCARGRCVPSQWVCDNEDDCGDGSDEVCPSSSTCSPDHFRCSSSPSGPCLNPALRCDGHPDCADQSDEEFCGPTTPAPLCPPGEFQCANGKCLPASRVCDGRLDCGFADASDEQVTCAPDQFACSDGTCVASTKLCDGTSDCPGGDDENRTICYTVIITPPQPHVTPTVPTSACRSNEFSCATEGQCVPRAWRCDGETDCMDGSDEQQCITPCGPGQVLCLSGDQCVDYQHLCDRTPHCRDASDESIDNCGSTQIPPCPGSFSCDNRTCVNMTQVCNSIPDCPRGEDELVCEPCPDDGCANTSCPTGLVTHNCAPCPVSCAHITSVTTCDSTAPCFSGCWCPEGQVMSHMQQCVLPEECVCEVAGVRYWPGQQMKVDCEICICERGRPQRCQPNADCSGDNDTILVTVTPATVTSEPAEGTTPLVPTYPLPPGDECWAPLGVQTLPASSFSASSQQTGHPPEAARLHGWDPHRDLQGWSPEPEEYKDLPQRSPGGHSSNTQSPYLQIDLLKPFNITGVLTQGGGVFGTFVSSFYIQFSQDGRQWHTYKELITDARPRAKVFLGNHDDRGVAESKLDRIVSAQFVRLLPHDFQNGIYLRLEIMGCGDGYQWLTTSTPPSPVSPVGGCRGKEFQCQNGRCVPAGPLGVVCNGVNDCGDGSDEMHCGKQPSTTATSPRSCPAGQFSCPPPGGCIEAGQRCDGILHCPKGEDEIGCHPHDNITTQSDRMVSQDIGVMEPGWSPLPTDAQPYFQVDFLEPMWVSGVVTQGGERMWGYLTKYRLAFALHSSLFTDYTDNGKPGGPAKVFEVRMVGRTPVTRWLDRLVRARYLRIIPVEFRHTFYMRFEIIGCRGDELVTPSSVTSPPSGGGKVTVQRCEPGQFACQHSEQCVSVSVLCDGRPDCKDHSDEINCGTAPTRGSPGLHNQTSSVGRPGFHGDSTTGAPGLHTTRSQGGLPGVATSGVTGQPGLQKTTIPTPWITTAPDDGGLPRVLCVEGQFACRTFGCVEAAQVCDGRRDCLDGSDEERCGTTARPVVTSVRPLVPSPCSPKQFPCESGECVHLDRRCDLQRDCTDGSDERDCVGCIMSSWTAWSACSVSCGLGSLFRQRDILREALPGGDCGGAQFDSRACFPRACPVDGHWSEWTEWSECDAQCGGGIKHRNRSCSAPPPKNGGRDCEGMTLQSQSCNSQSCTKDTDTQTGCVNGMLLVTDADCQAGRVGPCPPTCAHLSLTNNCTAACTLVLPDGVWSKWTGWSECSKTCFNLVDEVGIRRRFRSCNQTLPAFNSTRSGCDGDSEEQEPCNTVHCPGDGRVCPPGQEWTQCVRGAVSCTDLAMDLSRNCTPGCQCPQGTVKQDGVCVQESDCRCDMDGEQYKPGDIVSTDCNNCPQRSGSGLPCLGAHREDQVCVGPPCDLHVKLGFCSVSRCPVATSTVAGANGQPGPSARFLVEEESISGDDSVIIHLLRVVEEAAWESLSSRETATYTCAQECPCLVDKEFLASLKSVSVSPVSSLLLYNISEGMELQPGDTLVHDCSTCGCEHGRWNCSLEHCPVDGGLSPWGPWSPCSLSCGGLGLKTRFRGCTQPAPAHGGRDCQGARQETTYCQAPDCPVIIGPTEEPVLPDEDAGFSPWSLWSPCTKTCTDALRPAMKSRHRQCVKPPCSGSSHQEKACNLPQCPDGDEVCVGADCATRNCSWTEWGEWSFCSRSCGVGQQQRIRTFLSPGTNGSWCEDILRGNQEQRFCNIRPCRDEKGCPPGQEFVMCANQCPQRCADFQQGIECQGNTDCQPGCRCPEDCEAPFVYSDCGAPCEKQCALLGQGDLCLGVRECTPGCYCPKGLLQQNGSCVPPEECGCVHLQHQASGQPPTPVTVPEGSTVTLGCSTCLCHDGTLQCDLRECEVIISEWSEWTPCSPCAPSSSLQNSTFQDQVSSGTKMVSIQRRFRACLDLDSGVPVTREEEDSQCPGPLVEERLCPDANTCRGERCEDRGRTYQESCANQCPRSCTDLWEHVQCLQGACHAGCRCPKGQLLQDGRCVPLEECRCGIPSGNGTLEFRPKDEVTVDCNTCVCQGGAFNCTSESCDVDCVWSSWSEWSPCSASCGSGRQSSTRSVLQPSEYAGAPCEGPQERTKTCTAPDCACPDGEQWRRSVSEEVLLCERSCQDIYSSFPVNCSHAEGCVCHEGLYRNTEGEPLPECRRFMQVRNITKGDCRLDNVEVSFCRGRCLSRTDVILEEPYLQSVCECCSYRLDPDTPVRFLSLRCANGESEPVVLPVIHSCECTSCQELKVTLCQINHEIIPSSQQVFKGAVFPSVAFVCCLSCSVNGVETHGKGTGRRMEQKKGKVTFLLTRVSFAAEMFIHYKTM
ncbi:hypothetical protein F2P81_019426 [Scophthalmus maximus]|uniref:SCO-spondin n=1 Tax=Scophthalmus maximus TaxID=52904 RepID=A0A6A4S723_SCOMX|nr:hypothetical protein F2P81_019426 [Scophthalmus maximus]